MNAPVYAHEAAARTEDRAPVWPAVLWALMPFALALGVLCMSGCARPIDTAIVAANSAGAIGDASAEVLEHQCTARYRTAAPEDVPAIDAVCVPAARAYDAYRASYAALVAAIQVAQLRDVPSTPELLALLVRMTTIADSLSRAIGGVR